MNYLIGIIGILIASVLTNNIILNQSWAICPFLGVSKKMNSAFGMSIAVIFVLVLSSLICYLVNTYILDTLGIGFLSLIVNILIIAALVQLLETLIKRFLPTLYKALGVYLPLITTNCAVLLVANNVVMEGFFASSFPAAAGAVPTDAFQVIVYALGIGLGFMLAILLMAGMRERMERADIAPNFKDFPITLITAGLLAMAFYGLAGLNFFG